MKRTMALILVTALTLTLAGCSGAAQGLTGLASAAEEAIVTAIGTDAETATSDDTGSEAGSITVDYDAEDLDASVSGSGGTTIRLQGDSINVEGSGAAANGNEVIITSAGTYTVQGTLDNGQLIVNTQDQETVRLILNGADITCSTSAPIYVFDAAKVVITLADGTHNSVTDAAAYLFEDPGSAEPDAAIFSNDDLTINGTGSLAVVGNYKHGIASDDDLRITGGIITVTAVGDGLRGSDLLAVRDGVITVNAGGDALRAGNGTEADKGIVSIQGGTLNLTAAADGIQAETSLVVSDGDIVIVAGGGSGDPVVMHEAWGPPDMGNSIVVDDQGDSARGLQAGVSIQITGGTLDVDAADDGLHSNDSLVISGGAITLESGDDGIHSEIRLEIDDGTLGITQSYEGLESQAIVVNGGTLHVVASDDGFNATGGGGDFGGFPGGAAGGFGGSGDYTLDIHGGTIVVDAGGDGFDINGPITMTAGLVIINGPTSDTNGAVDYTGSFRVSGGTLIAAGSAGMAMAPDESSSQYSLMITFSSALPAGTIVHIETESGEEILTFAPTKPIQSIVVSTAELKDGTTYVVYTGGSTTGSAVDGMYSGGTYTAGTEYASVTTSGVVTVLGSYGGGLRGGPGGDRPQPGDRRP